jgi:hypothetical protein
VYEGIDTFAPTLPIRVDSGNTPDLAMFPQPGFMSDFARERKLIPLINFMTPEQLQDVYPKTWLNLDRRDSILGDGIGILKKFNHFNYCNCNSSRYQRFRCLYFCLDGIILTTIFCLLLWSVY